MGEENRQQTDRQTEERKKRESKEQRQEKQMNLKNLKLRKLSQNQKDKLLHDLCKTRIILFYFTLYRHDKSPLTKTTWVKLTHILITSSR